MVTLHTGNRLSRGTARRGFTLVELLLVMALLTIVIAVGAPSLSRFFKGRYVDSEAQRFLGLTRYAQSRAVAEGVPMVLWVNLEKRTYGLHADAGFIETDKKALEYTVAESVKMRLTLPEHVTLVNPNQEFDQELNIQPQTEGENEFRFLPDGFLGQECPSLVEFYEDGKEDAAIRVAQSRNGLNYEIQPRTL